MWKLLSLPHLPKKKKEKEKQRPGMDVAPNCQSNCGQLQVMGPVKFMIKATLNRISPSL